MQNPRIKLCVSFSANVILLIVVMLMSLSWPSIAYVSIDFQSQDDPFALPSSGDHLNKLLRLNEIINNLDGVAFAAATPTQTGACVIIFCPSYSSADEQVRNKIKKDFEPYKGKQGLKRHDMGTDNLSIPSDKKTFESEAEKSGQIRQ